MAAVRPADFWNFNRAQLSTGARDTLERVVREAVAEKGLNPKDRKPMAEVQAAAGDINPDDVAMLGRANALRTEATIHPEVYYRAREVAQGYAREATDIRARASRAGARMDGSLRLSRKRRSCKRRTGSRGTLGRSSASSPARGLTSHVTSPISG